MTYDSSPQKYQNIPNIPHFRHLASYMWDMVEFGLDLMGANLDLLAADGFRLDIAVSMLLDHAEMHPECIDVRRIKEAAELYVHLITDLNLRVGNRVIAGEKVEETMQDWLVEFEKDYPMATLPPYIRALSPIHTWKNIVIIADSAAVFYYGSAKTKSAGKRIRLYEGLAKGVGAFPASDIPHLRWNCEEGSKYDGPDRCHNDLAVAGADYHSWLDYVRRYIKRAPPDTLNEGRYPDDHLVIWFDVGNSWARSHKPEALRDLTRSCSDLCRTLRSHWKNVIYVEATKCGIWADVDNAVYRRTFHESFRPSIRKSGIKIADGRFFWPQLAPYLHETERYHMGSLWREDERQNAAYKVWAGGIQRLAGYVNACHRDLGRAEIFRRRPEFYRRAIESTVDATRKRLKLPPLPADSFHWGRGAEEVRVLPAVAPEATPTSQLPTPQLPGTATFAVPKAPRPPSAAPPPGPQSWPSPAEAKSMVAKRTAKAPPPPPIPPPKASSPSGAVAVPPGGAVLEVAARGEVGGQAGQTEEPSGTHSAGPSLYDTIFDINRVCPKLEVRPSVPNFPFTPVVPRAARRADQIRLDHLYAWLHGRACAIQPTDINVQYDVKQDGTAFLYLELENVFVFFNPHDTRDLPALDAMLPKGVSQRLGVHLSSIPGRIMLDYNIPKTLVGEVA